MARALHPLDRFGVRNTVAETPEGVRFRFECSLLEDEFPVTRVYTRRPEDGETENYIGTIQQSLGAQRFMPASHITLALSEAGIFTVGAYMRGDLERDLNHGQHYGYELRRSTTSFAGNVD